MGRRGIGLLLVVALAFVATTGAAGAWPGEDGQAANPSPWYDDTPDPSGWHTGGGSTDRVQDIAQIGNTIYVAGTFPSIVSPTGTTVAQANLAAFDATTGAHIPGFAPVISDTVYSLAVSPDGSRLYAGGRFTTVNGVTMRRVASLDPATGALTPGWDSGVNGNVRSILLRGPHLYVGGNFTNVGAVSHERLARLSATTGALDATWTATAQTDVVYTLEMPSDGSRLYVGGRFTAVNNEPNTAWIAAVDTGTGALISSFDPDPGREVFDMLADDSGRVWAALGGALGRAEVWRASDGGRVQRWETDGDVQSVEQIGDRVYFGGHELAGPDRYLAVVEMDDLTTWDVVDFVPPVSGFDGVWAFHSTGNWLWIGGQHTSTYFGFARYPWKPAPPEPESLLSAGSQWRYLDNGSDQGTAWRAPAFDDSTWPVGDAQLGFGDGDEATTLATGRTTYWFRTTFTLADADAFRSATLELLADDGAVVYLNGVEVGRDNMPAGTVSASTRTVTFKSGAAESTFVELDVPLTALQTGENTLAVEVHQADPGSSDLSLDARLEAWLDDSAPTVPANLASPAQTQTSADLTWDAATDDVAVDHYDVFVDGSLADTTDGTSTTLAGLAAATTYSVTIEAVDAAGNRSGLSTALPVTTPPPPGPPAAALLETFAQPVGGTYTPLVGDFDGDGDDDIFWYAPGRARDFLWRANGDGRFTPLSRTVNGTYLPFTGNFDGDGDDDIYWYAPGRANDYIWRADGINIFAGFLRRVYGTYSPRTGDFDDDGDADILWYTAAAGGDVLWESNGPPLTFAGRVAAVPSGFTPPLPGDFNADDHGDVFGYVPGTGGDSLLRGDDDRFIHQAFSQNGTFSRPFSGDFDGNGATDVFWYQPGVGADLIWRFADPA